jgi:hypothetical protein
MEEMRKAQEILIRGPEGRDYSEVLGIDGRKTLEYTLGRKCGTLWTGSM